MPILIETTERVGPLTLNDPNRNALDEEMAAHCSGLVGVGQRPRHRLLIVHRRGESFSSRGNVKDMLAGRAC